MVGLALTALHVLALGFPSWTNPAHWPGHLPPISLLSCVVAIGVLPARCTEVKVTYRAARWVMRFRRIPTPSSSTSTTSPATMRFVVPGVPV